MPLLLAAVGIVLIVAAVRGSTTTLFELVHNDLTGQNNFLVWLGAILGLGLFGYIKPVRPISAGLITLVMVALVLSNKGFFANFAAAFQATVNTPQQNITTGTQSSSNGGANGATQTGQLSGLQPFQMPPDFLNDVGISQSGGNSNSDLGNIFGNILGGDGGSSGQAADIVMSLF